MARTTFRSNRSVPDATLRMFIDFSGLLHRPFRAAWSPSNVDLEPLPPNPDEFWTSPGVTETDAGLTAPRRRWSTRARVAAACSAVGIAGVAGFGFTEIATGGGVPAFGSLLAASSGSGSSPSTAPATKTLRGAAFGTVSNLSGPNFTVTNTRRATTSTTNVVTDTNTGFTKTFKGAVSDIKTGQTIAARGARNADGSIAASDIVVLPDGALAGKAPASPPPAPSGPAPAGPRPEMRMRGGGGVGTVKSVSSGVITITTLRGDTQTIDTTASTTVIETVKAALSDVTNGATVAVVGT